MKSIIDILSERFRQAITPAYPELAQASDELSHEVKQSTQDKFGHYQFNGAMKLSKMVNQNPRQIAEQLIKHLEPKTPEGKPFIEKLEIAGPGFINITIHPEFLSEAADVALKDPHLGIDLPKKRQRIIIDFSSPNTAKEMHVGHLRSTIIGDSLARLFEFLGHDVVAFESCGRLGNRFWHADCLYERYGT